jgi:hypothetical protein
LRVRGLKVDVDDVETLRVEREGLKAVRRRCREVDVLRSGVKDWKRFWRWGEDIFEVVGWLVVVWWG